MKTINLLVFLLFATGAYSFEINEKEIKTDVSAVTVFIEGAQITRAKTVDLPEGTTILKFVNLSPFIDSKSVQVKANGDVTVLAVNHQQNYIDKLKKSDEVTELESKIEILDKQLELENTYLSILAGELAFLKDNRVIGGKNNEVTVDNLKQASEYYSSKLTTIKLAEIERASKIEVFQKQKRELQMQLRNMSSKKEYPMGEILVKVKCKSKTIPQFELSYFVKNAGWFPSYDVRVKDIDSPIEVVYKANLRQDTKVNWTNVQLEFSSSNPNNSGVAPELETYYLGYNLRPPVYRKNINVASGQVFDEKRAPMPGVNVMVPGSTIGTITDMNGYYSVTLPPNTSELAYSFIGYIPQTITISSSNTIVYMQPDMLMLDEVVTVAYGINEDSEPSSSLQGKAPGVRIRGVSKTGTRGAESIPISMQKTENQTSIEFKIKTPYTVNSDNKNYTVDMIVYQVPAMYQYFSIPKIDKDAFLLANIINWEQYNLLEGEANIFFEGTYIGKSLLDVRSASDTLQLSLGRDKNVSIKRVKIKDHSSRQFIGTKKEETRTWRTTVKNNKSQAINLIVLDQVPVSNHEDIEVELVSFSKGIHQKETGEIKWELTIDPSANKEFELKYSVKYPKSKDLIIE